jgi:hypothetical protein
MSRVYRLKTYPNCFLGDEAVQWLVSSGQATNPMEALAIGNAMIRAGFMQHVTGEHAFKDKPYFYRFLQPLEEGPRRCDSLYFNAILSILNVIKEAKIPLSKSSFHYVLCTMT